MSIVIVPPMINWNWMKQRPQQLMKHLARLGHTVYFCNMTQADVPVECIEDNLYVVHHHDRWKAEQLPKLRQQSHKPLGVWCSFPKVCDTVTDYKADWVIYDCVDDFAQWLPYERKMVDISNAIVCTADRIEARLNRMYPEKNIVLIRNGYDEDLGLHCRQASSFAVDEPEDLPRDGRKRVGYTGAWAPWVDERIIRGIAEWTDSHVIVIGAEFRRKFDLQHPRVHYLGHKPHDTLTAYLSHLDVLTIPFKLNPVSLATNPIKLYEYLATGKPVVSTMLPECKPYAPWVDLADDLQSFIRRVKLRLQHPGDPAPRQACALNNTWHHRAVEAHRLIAAIES